MVFYFHAALANDLIIFVIISVPHFFHFPPLRVFFQKKITIKKKNYNNNNNSNNNNNNIHNNNNNRNNNNNSDNGRLERLSAARPHLEGEYRLFRSLPGEVDERTRQRSYQR